MDEVFLQRAVDLALANVERREGGPFGAVIVLNGTILAEGANQVVGNVDPTAHAEIVAIRAACRQLGQFHLPDCVLYASSEPCPMCLSAAYWARIGQVVFATPRRSAAAVGFCDDELYDELRRPSNDRRIVLRHLPLPGAETPFERWKADSARVPY